MTINEKKIYDFVCKNIREKGYSPSIRDICSATGIPSTSTVHTCLSALEKKGYIQRDSGKSRTLRVENADRMALAILPLVETVADGTYVLDEENHAGHVDFPVRAGDIPPMFALRMASGDMAERGLLEGDFVIAEATHAADDGDTIIVLSGRNLLVRTVFYEDGCVRLETGEGTSVVYADDVPIIGKVIASVRYY